MYIMGLLKNCLGIFNLFLGNMYGIKAELDPFEEKSAKIIQIFLSKRLSGSNPILPKKFRIRIYRTGFSVPDFLKIKLMVDTTISDLHRFHYGSGSKKAKSMLIHADKNPKHWLAPQLVLNGLTASI
jgi:hypothetical protein